MGGCFAVRVGVATKTNGDGCYLGLLLRWRGTGYRAGPFSGYRCSDCDWCVGGGRISAVHKASITYSETAQTFIDSNGSCSGAGYRVRTDIVARPNDTLQGRDRCAAAKPASQQVQPAHRAAPAKVGADGGWCPDGLGEASAAHRTAGRTITRSCCAALRKSLRHRSGCRPYDRSALRKIYG